ncbi:molybdopterin-dependent oxidoreductase [Eggerthella sinensis]|uniref:molybdopterin-dependent oxidoreductase n=1 Tax=Eggerthella sinensis TaxID=242230 RepID=UPI00266C94C2|nr:molybdopterin-dependent oxidoreductase [Eggerthella sinensis]
MNLNSMKLTRRSFAKSTVAVAAAAGLGGALAYRPVKAFANTPNAAVQGEQGEVYGHCRMCMLCGSCSFVATMKDGVVVNIEGDPDRANNAGTLCPRGKSAIMNVYNPHRIKAPMKRTNPEKGMEIDPQWVEITWDEALDIAAEKIRECYDTDIRKLVQMYGFGPYESGHATLGIGLWAMALGTPNSSSTKGQMCAIHYGGCYTLSAFPTVNYDGVYCNYLVILGKSVGYDSGLAGGDARTFANCLRRGMKYVTVGPRASMEATRGEWVSAKLGSDLSLVYAWMHCMLYELENGFDEPFVKNRTNSPYLIDANGDYVRNDEGKPQIWDASSDSAKSHDDPSLADPALFGQYDFNGTPCQPAFQAFKESLKTFTPEWAEAYSTVPADKIREIAVNLVSYASFGSTVEIDGETLPLRPAAVIIGRGITNQEDGTLCDIYSRVLNMLLGNVGSPGGIISNMYCDYLPNELDGTTEPYFEAKTCTKFNWPPQGLDYADVFPHRHSTNTLMMRTMCDPEKYGFDYKPSVVVSCGSNPVTVTADAAVAEQAMKSVDYVIYQGCYHMDEMAMLSDLLLPEHASLETHTCHLFPGNEGSATNIDPGFAASNRGVVVRKGMKPLYNTLDGNDQLIEIFDRMGLIDLWNETANQNGCIGYAALTGFGQVPPAAVQFEDPAFKLQPGTKYTAEEMFDRCLKSAFGADKGLDHLDKVKMMPYNGFTGANVYPSHRNQKIRFTVYLEAQKRSGDFLIPKLREVQESGFDLEGAIKYSIDELRRRYTAVPYWPEHRQIDSAPSDFELYAFNYRQPFYMFRLANMDQDPIRRDYSKRYMPDDNSVLVNTATAQERGIGEGDMIVVESPFGTTKGKAHLTETVRPDSVGIGGARGRKTSWMGKELLEDTCMNDIMSGDFGYIDPIHGGVIDTVRVKIYKA